MNNGAWVTNTVMRFTGKLTLLIVEILHWLITGSLRNLNSENDRSVHWFEVSAIAEQTQISCFLQIVGTKNLVEEDSKSFFHHTGNQQIKDCCQTVTLGKKSLRAKFFSWSAKHPLRHHNRNPSGRTLHHSRLKEKETNHEIKIFSKPV